MKSTANRETSSKWGYEKKGVPATGTKPFKQDVPPRGAASNPQITTQVLTGMFHLSLGVE